MLTDQDNGFDRRVPESYASGEAAKGVIVAGWQIRWTSRFPNRGGEVWNRWRSGEVTIELPALSVVLRAFRHRHLNSVL